MEWFEVMKIFIIIEDIIKKVEKWEVGVIIIFIGMVWEWINGKRMVWFEYEVYELMVV